jgi:hypothetical protein
MFSNKQVCLKPNHSRSHIRVGIMAAHTFARLPLIDPATTHQSIAATFKLLPAINELPNANHRVTGPGQPAAESGYAEGFSSQVNELRVDHLPFHPRARLVVRSQPVAYRAGPPCHCLPFTPVTRPDSEQLARRSAFDAYHARVARPRMRAPGQSVSRTVPAGFGYAVGGASP